MKYLDQLPNEMYGALMTVFIVITSAFFYIFLTSITY